MAEGFLRSVDPEIDVISAGTRPASVVHPLAVAVMREMGIDISGSAPKHVEQFVSQTFDVVITVCDDAREACPVFTGSVRTRLHFGFDDPAIATGTSEHVIAEFRRVRDEIQGTLRTWYESTREAPATTRSSRRASRRN